MKKKGCWDCQYEADCEGIDPGTDECAEKLDQEEDYYEPSEHDEWMDYDPDC